MKNIQVIDGALNCTFSIFQAADEEFALLFPEARQLSVMISFGGRRTAPSESRNPHVKNFYAFPPAPACSLRVTVIAAFHRSVATSPVPSSSVA